MVDLAKAGGGTRASRAKTVCSVEDCGVGVHARGWCNKHYNRWRRHGGPTETRIGKTFEENKVLILVGKMRCTSCNRVKNVGLFYKKKGNRLGYTQQCRACLLRLASSSGRTTRLKRYSLTHEDYNTLAGLTDNRCWICGGGSVKSLAVDHNHTNGNVRGLLCVPCNRILGRWKDDPAKAKVAMEYLIDDGQRVKLALGRQPKGAML